MKVLRRGLWAVAAGVALVLQLAVLNWLSPVIGLLAPLVPRTFVVAAAAPQPIANIDTTDSGPGTLLSATTMPTLDPGYLGADVRAARIFYR